ncbi:unnamed protein product [Parnassius mnemosyne]|uniref:Uncharacterized protein n=1 Tax=Parnassius mnemosyne TaxID=213953 RepID=A0AAV1KBM3_9NEOP
MRQLYLWLLAVLIFLLSSAKCSDLGRDGFNFYKDYLRARSDDNIEEEPLPERMSYFYRTPVQIYSGLLPNADLAYRKRTGNVFKNRMLNKEVWIGEAPNKRSSKTALSLMLHSKQPYHTANNISGEDLESYV